MCSSLALEPQTSVLFPTSPTERFTLLVLTAQPDDKEAKVPLSKVTEEVAKRIKDRKSWFLVSNRRDRAELTVEVMNHTLEERMRTRMEYRVDATGTNKELVDITWNEEHHFIEARIHLPGGHQTLLTGADERERGGSFKGAASDLAESSKF
ncbi:MAG TPA: hypothetical protein VLK65_01850 [Vicinamibacteria bacterium]|nr:hypothetical protein [Vicinamibacteria bacterium]